MPTTGALTINPTMPPTVDEFRKLFPEFADISDEHVQFYLDIGVSWVDTFWDLQDAKVASMYVAAHYIWIHDLASGGTLSSEAGGGSGGGGSTSPIDPEVGKIWIKSVRFRDRQVTYERVGMASDSSKSSGQEANASAEFWESSPYGLMYLSLRRRNVPHCAVV
jgi:hypothetical protein